MSHKALSRLFLSVFCVVAVLTGPALADENQPQDATIAVSPKDIDKIWERVNLTPEQRKQMLVLRTKFKQQADALKTQINLTQVEFKRQVAAPASNTMRLQALLQHKLTLEAQLQKAALDCFVAMKQLLTDEQRVALQRALLPNTVIPTYR